MSPDLFPKYLKEPSLLYRISYEELKTLVVQYPYCQNLRYLLLIKSKMDGNVEQDRNMKMASAYSLDRTKLYLLLKNDLKENQKDFEFLDLNHAVTDEENAELELPVLDFSKGIELEEKDTSNKVSELDLTQPFSDIESEPKSSEEKANDLLALFDEDEDEDEIDVENETPPVLPEMVLPLVPPLHFSFNFKETDLEPVLKEKTTFAKPIPLPLVPPNISISFPEKFEAEIQLESLVLPLVPPSISLDIIAKPIVSKAQQTEAVQAIKLPSVPPMIPLDIIPTPIIEAIEEVDNNEPIFTLPLVPPTVEIDGIVEEEIEEETVSFAQEIDDSIMAALTRLAHQQKLELEQEEREKEALLMASVKEEIQHEDSLNEEEDKEEEWDEDRSLDMVINEMAKDLSEEETIPEEVEENKLSDGQGPMPKASFSSWLKQMQAPAPSIHPREPLKKKKAKKVDEKLPIDKKVKSAKKSKKKKKKTQIENEGSRLIKAFKARQSEERKQETKLMLIRKKKVMELAERSLRENEEIISETLAKILMIQGKKGKAIHMYRQLMLKFPKKSSFFAAEIEKIQKQS